jgi:hypothetical protein
LRPRLTTGLPFSLAHTDAHALLRTHHTYVRSRTQCSLEDVFPMQTMLSRIAWRLALSQSCPPYYQGANFVEFPFHAIG